jgi:hypothetical protein
LRAIVRAVRVDLDVLITIGTLSYIPYAQDSVELICFEK